MTTVYRITKSPDVGELVVSEHGLEAFARENGPGRYQVDQHSLEPFPGSHMTARSWGKILHKPDGQIVRDPHPWEAI